MKNREAEIRYRERRKQMYRERREKLIAALGGKCCECNSTENLEFDHPFGRDWIARQKARWHRIVLYEGDQKAGNLRLLCSNCNKVLLPLFGDDL